MEKIKVFLSDPQILFREGIHFTLSGEEEFDVTGEATNNEDAMAAMESNPPSVAILNMKNGKLDGPEATRRIKRNLPSVSVILVSDKADEEQLFLALKSGASACLTKDVDPENLVNLIKGIHKGNRPIVDALLMPGPAAKALAEFEALSALSEHLHNVLAHLSPKEAEVLKRIADGNTAEQVAGKLSIGEDALRHQLQLVAQKLVANDQARAMIDAVQRSLPSILSGIQGRPAADYITKAEFIEFKDNMMQSLKSLIGELTLPNKR